MFPVVPLMECICHELLGLLECLVMCMTSMLIIHVYLLNFLNRTIDIINFEKFFFSSKFYRRHHELVSKLNVGLTVVWHNFFLMNVFFALKGSKLFIIICYHCSWMLCHVTAVKSLPALIYSADYILLLVL